MSTRKKTLTPLKKKPSRRPRPKAAAAVKAVKPVKPVAPVGSGEADDGDDKANAIRHAAFICFSERGYHDTSVDAICREAGISKGAFYWYFQSKEAVFLQILEVWAVEVEQEVMRQFQEAFADTEPVSALLAALSREGRRGRRVLPIWLDGLVQSQRNPALREALARFMQRLRDGLTDVIRPAFAPYHSDDEVRRIAGLLFSCFIGSISQHIVDPEAGHYDEQCRQLLVTTERFANLIKDQPTRLEALPHE